MIVMMMKMKTAGRVAGETRARLLVGGVAETHVTLAKSGPSGAVRQGRGRLRRRRLGLLLLGRLLLLLLLLGRRMRVVMLLLVLLVLSVLDRGRGHRLVHGDPTALLVQGAAMEVALAARPAVRPVDRAAVPRHRLMNVIRTLGRVDMNGVAVEGIGTLLHQPGRDSVWLRLRLLLLLLSLPHGPDF